jgi:hypothetical protein
MRQAGEVVFVDAIVHAVVYIAHEIAHRKDPAQKQEPAPGPV